MVVICTEGIFPLKPWVNLFCSQGNSNRISYLFCVISVGIVINIRRASFGWTELSERRIAERVCVQERPAWAIPIALSGVAVASTPEIEEWSCLKGSRRRNDVSACPLHLVRWEPYAREKQQQLQFAHVARCTRNILQRQQHFHCGCG